MNSIHVGISGWTYPPWRAVFFPKGWPQKRELEYASRRVNSIEINGTFYSLQRPESFTAWHDATPRGFMFSVKGGRFITHLKRLQDVEVPLANFFASGILNLREKLGPILWQLPPSFRYDHARLAEFFALLPRDTREAAKLARKHDAKVSDRAEFKVDRVRPLRHALEVRHKTFETPAFVDLLREHRIALVVADTAGKWPLMEDVTSDFIYLRLHGDEDLYVSGYTEAALQEWARKIRAWSRGHTPTRTKRVGPAARRTSSGRDVFVYFDNDVKVRAPLDAMSLAHRLKLGPAPKPSTNFSETRETARESSPEIQRQWYSATSE
ncbi:MAG: DUF72 domain-containing protein [Chthoniobacteraceae bacterium]